MTQTDDLARLAEQVAAGESIALDELPEVLRNSPQVKRLLRFALVAEQLGHNVGWRPPETKAPSQIGHWQLTRRLGSGGMGEVWLGERIDGRVEHRVAIKRVHGASAQFVAQLDSERRILAKLAHPNIAHFVDAGVDDSGAPWLAMAYIEGCTLREWRDQQQPSLAARLQLFAKICLAVAHAHRYLIVHRDIKPSNILIDGDGEPRLLDFGVAKLLDGSNNELTAAALTPAYAAPEQLRLGSVSTATDVYSLGLLLYDLVAGALPASRCGDSIASVLEQIDQEETQRPSATAAAQATHLPYRAELLRGDLDAIVSKAIRAEPEARYRSADALGADVQRYLHGQAVHARAPTAWYLFARFSKRNRWPVAFAAVAVVALLVGSSLALWQGKVAAEAAVRAERDASIARAQAARAKRYGAFVLSVFQQSDVLKRDGRGVISIDEAFEDSLARIDQEFSDDAMVAADLNDDFGELLASKGRFDEAQIRFENALRLAETAHGSDSLEAAESLLNLAVLSSYRGKSLDGKAWIERAVHILATHPDADPVLLGNARMTLGSVLMQARESDAARSEIREGLRLYRENMQADDQRMSSAIFNAGAMEHAQGNFAEAQPYLDEAIALVERVQGAQSAALLPIIDFQMSNLDRLARHDEAAAAALRLRDIADVTYPDAHPLRASARMEVGYHQMHSGHLDAGRAELADGIAMSMALDSSHELIGWSLLIKALRDAQQWPELLSENVNARPRCQHYADADTRRCEEIAAYALEATAVSNRNETTLTQIETQLAANQAAAKPSSIVHIALLGAKARALQSLGRSEAATQILDEQVAALRARFPEQHRDVQAALAWRRALAVASASERAS